MGGKRSIAMSPEDLLKWHRLEVGDMIQFDVPEKSGKIHHWAIYVGGEDIIHLTTTAGSLSGISSNYSPSSKNTGLITKESLLDYAGTRKVGVNNWADDGYEVLDYFLITKRRHVKTSVATKEVIVQRAEKYLANPKLIKNYDVLKNNCEAFATLCRYGESLSGQNIAFWNGWKLPLIKLG